MPNRIKFTTTTMDRLREPGIYWDTQTPGLGCRVSASGMRTYFYKRRVKGSGVERNVSLGRHGDPVLVNDALRSFPFGADDARAKAAAVQAQMLAGVDPVQKLRDDEAATGAKAVQDKALAITLRTVVTDYLDQHLTKAGRPLRPKTKRDYHDFMDRHFKDWLDKPAKDVTAAMCLPKLRGLGAKTKTQMRKAELYLRMFFGHARKMGKGAIFAVNPIDEVWELRGGKAPKIGKRRRSIPLGKIGAVWVELRRRAANAVKDLDRTGADWVTTLLLTGWRSTECAALQWSWINFDAKTVTLPGDLEVTADNEFGFVGVKTHAAITLPLSDVLFDLLKERRELPDSDSVYVFPARAGAKRAHITTAHGTMRAIAESAGCIEVKDGKKIYLLSPHDLRRTFKRAALDCRVDEVHRKQLTNHASESVAEDYERDDDPETLRIAANTVVNYIVDAGRVAAAQASGANVVSLVGRGKPA